MQPHIVIKSLIAIGIIAVSTACVDEITSPTCTPVTLNVASTRGDTVTLNTGLRLINGVEGTGVPSVWCAPIAVHYTEFLLDGTRLESSRDADNPVIFTPGLGDLIDGFEQGVIGVRAGGTRRLIVPANLAYGNQERRNAAGTIIVPSNSTLVYDIEVLQVGQPQ
jgi:FKBP-type peptidyl-prolyl cis-trans isomerase